MNRRDFLKLAGWGGLGALLLQDVGCGGGGSQAASSTLPFKKPPNILILMTDEQRAAQHWPAGFADANLPSLNRLRAHGLNFNFGFANACQCSPSRATFLTGKYAPVNLVTVTDGTLNPSLPNLARILASAGYNVVYKGKWHLTVDYITPYSVSNPSELSMALLNDQGLQTNYGFSGWNSPDGGTSIGILETLGGGVGGNDARYVEGQNPGDSTTNIIQFLTQYDSDAPFCLIASLVNPHDVFVYPSLIGSSGYDVSAFSSLPIELPPTFNEDLSTKPIVQASFVSRLNTVWPFASGTDQQVLYGQFYAYLNALADTYLMQILDTLDAKGLTANTLIVRVADHGEMGLSHGGLRQKDYTAYEEMIRIPLIFSNPILFPKPVETDCLAGLIDVLPTLATVAGLQAQQQQWSLQGRDLTPLFSSPNVPVQDRILFTYDDALFAPLGPGHIRCIRERNWKYALYFDPAGAYADEYEMYDLKNDPLEQVNLANGQTPPAYQHERARLQAELTAMMQKTGTLPSQYMPPTAD
ncbi:MAG: sulfatase-like hydrolase/transferase [Candidatus Binataceae bacterium]